MPDSASNTPDEPEFLSKTELAHRLYNVGIQVPTIADSLDLSIDEVRSILLGTVAQIRDDAGIRERMLRLANESIDEMFKIIRSPNPARKDPLLRAMASNLSKVLARESSQDYEELRLALETLFAHNRIDTTGLPHALTLNPIPIEPDDPDEETRL